MTAAPVWSLERDRGELLRELVDRLLFLLRVGHEERITLPDLSCNQLMSINFVGDGLRDAFDPRQRRKISRKERAVETGSRSQVNKS